MENKDKKKKVEKKRQPNEEVIKDTLMRLPVLIVSGITFYAWGCLIAVFFIINFFHVLFTKKRIDDLSKMSETWNTHQYYFFRYITFSTNELPFPFSEIKKDLNKA